MITIINCCSICMREESLEFEDDLAAMTSSNRQAIKRCWPQNPERHASKSALQRFWSKARSGMLKDNGIDITLFRDRKSA